MEGQGKWFLFVYFDDLKVVLLEVVPNADSSIRRAGGNKWFPEADVETSDGICVEGLQGELATVFLILIEWQFENNSGV